MTRFGYATTPKLMTSIRHLPGIACPKCAHQNIWSWGVARIDRHDKSGTDSSPVLQWRVRGAYLNCVRLPMATYSIGGTPRTTPDQSQLHSHQFKCWASLELPLTVVKRLQSAHPARVLNIITIFRKHIRQPKHIASQPQIPTASGRPFTSSEWQERRCQMHWMNIHLPIHIICTIKAVNTIGKPRQSKGGDKNKLVIETNN